LGSTPITSSGSYSSSAWMDSPAVNAEIEHTVPVDPLAQVSEGLQYSGIALVIGERVRV
jgi:hypothetical protein